MHKRQRITDQFVQNMSPEPTTLLTADSEPLCNKNMLKYLCVNSNAVRQNLCKL